MLVWASLTYATYGIIVLDGIVTEVAPIAQWMIGKPWEVCEKWLRSKNAEIKFVESYDDIERAAIQEPGM